MKRSRPADHEGQDTWGWRFQRRRDELGLSQADICRITGLTQQAISRFENDQVHPRAETLEKYARSVASTVEDLFPQWARPQGKSPAATKRQRDRINGRKGNK